jgi:hypothetical protein
MSIDLDLTSHARHNGTSPLLCAERPAETHDGEKSYNASLGGGIARLARTQRYPSSENSCGTVSRTPRRAMRAAFDGAIDLADHHQSCLDIPTIFPEKESVITAGYKCECMQHPERDCQKFCALSQLIND